MALRRDNMRTILIFVQVASANTNKRRLQPHPSLLHLRDFKLIYTNVLGRIEAHSLHRLFFTHACTLLLGEWYGEAVVTQRLELLSQRRQLLSQALLHA